MNAERGIRRRKIRLGIRGRAAEGKFKADPREKRKIGADFLHDQDGESEKEGN